MLVLALCAVLVGVSGIASARQASTVVEPSASSSASVRPGAAARTGAAATGVGSALDGGDSAPGTAPAGGASIFVHLLGHVVRPGLYEVPAGSRLIDVVSAAGGLAADADQSRVNLAERAVDGAQVTVPAVGDPEPSSASTPPEGAAPGPGTSGAGASGTQAGTVDLNTADLAGLQELSGVGPATAQAILDWRAEHGRFEAVEDLLDVTGIGDKKFEKLRDHVTAS